MRSCDLIPGQWFWCGHSRLCVGQNDGVVHFCNAPYSHWSMARDIDVELLPPNAGYDYVRPRPIDPGDGWRLVGEGEQLQLGDEWRYLTLDAWRAFDGDNKSIFNYTAGWFNSKVPLSVARRRIVPQYRPFAGAAEFAPHRDRWLRHKSGLLFGQVVGYRDSGVWCRGDNGSITYQQLFDVYVFDDDGLPLGVEVKP